MRISKLAKSMWKYLPVLAVLVAALAVLLIGKHLYPIASDIQPPTATQTEIELNNLPPAVSGTLDPCGIAVFTSLPPKCKTFDGTFIPLPGTSFDILPTPEP